MLAVATAADKPVMIPRDVLVLGHFESSMLTADEQRNAFDDQDSQREMLAKQYHETLYLIF